MKATVLVEAPISVYFCAIVLMVVCSNGQAVSRGEFLSLKASASSELLGEQRQLRSFPCPSLVCLSDLL